MRTEQIIKIEEMAKDIAVVYGSYRESLQEDSDMDWKAWQRIYNNAQQRLTDYLNSI